MERKIHLYFRKPFNCAQTVMRIIEDEDAISAKKIEKAKQHGGGNAPEELCEALYAVLQYLPKEDRCKFRKAFQKSIGSEKCKDIRKENKFSCQECIKKAMELYSKFKN